MSLIEDINNDIINQLSTESLFELVRAIVISYDDDCSEVSGWNISDVDNIPISILNLKAARTLTDLDREDANFMWKTLLIDCIINMDYNESSNKDELIQILQEKYKDNQHELSLINNFNMNYRKNDAIQWYKEESCIYRELNAALRSTCLNRILAYRFFIRDLSLQLKEEQNNLLDINDENVIYLYSGKRTSDIEIDRLKNLKSDCLISIDSFFSTSRNESVANNFMKGSDKPGKPLIPIRYDLKCNLRLKTKPYADISAERFGAFSGEEEVLFMVDLTKSLIGIASVQCSLGRYDFSIQIFDQIIKNINNINNIDLRRYYEAIAYYEKSQPLLEKGKNFDALKQCQHALSIFTKYHGEIDSLTANCYEMIGNIYGNLGRLEKTKHNING